MKTLMNNNLNGGFFTTSIREDVVGESMNEII